MYFKVRLVSRGKRTDCVVEADNKRLAAIKARKQVPDSYVLDSREVPLPLEVVIAQFKNDFLRRSKGKIPLDQKISTIRQIAVMTDAGIAIHDTLEEVAQNVENKRLKEIYSKISADINAGKSMSDAIMPYKEDFGQVAIAMTKLGESTGNFPGSYHKLANILEDIRDNVSKFKKAIRSPLITLVAMGIAFTILIMVVVPKFRAIFDKFKTELPLPTRMLLGIEHALSTYGLYILIFLIVSIYILIFIYKNNERFKYKIDKMMLHPKFYLINKAVFISTMHKYTLVFGELVKSGIPVLESLNTAVGMVDNAYIKEKLLAVNANIGRGMSLSESLEKTELFQNMLLQMIKAGESSGQLDDMLGKVTGYYDMLFRDFIDNLSSYIEPIMMFFIAALVLLMALGIFMPMWDLGSAVKHG